MRKKIKDWIDEFYYLILLQIPLILLTGIDYIMHNWLYNWGLRFDYSWAYPYWILLALTFVSIGAVGASAYVLDRKRRFIRLKKKKIFAVFFTLIAEHFAAYLDSLFWLIHALAGKRVDWISNWWWSPYSKIFGYWNLGANLLLNLITLILLYKMWKWARSEN